MIGQDNFLPLLGWKILLILANLGWTILGENGHDSQFFWQVIYQVPIFNCTKQEQKQNTRMYLKQLNCILLMKCNISCHRKAVM